MKVIIPARTLNELNRLLGDQEEPVEIMMTPAKGQIMFRIRSNDTVEMVSQLLQGSFPNYEQLIPQNYTTRAILDLPAMLRATRTAAIFARDGSNIIRMHVIPANGDGGAGKVVISARSEEVWRQPGRGGRRGDRGRKKGRLPSTAATFWTSCRCWSGGRWRWKQPLPPAPEVFKPIGSDEYVHVVMPMFVQW